MASLWTVSVFVNASYMSSSSYIICADQINNTIMHLKVFKKFFTVKTVLFISRLGPVIKQLAFTTRCSAIEERPDRAAGCVIVFAKSRRLQLGDNILRIGLASTTVI